MDWSTAWSTAWCMGVLFSSIDMYKYSLNYMKLKIGLMSWIFTEDDSKRVNR